MNKTRTASKWFAGLAVVTTLFLSAATAPAQAKDSGWGGTMVQPKDSGWGGTY
jgi:hypothetical protein